MQALDSGELACAKNFNFYISRFIFNSEIEDLIYRCGRLKVIGGSLRYRAQIPEITFFRRHFITDIA
jgi:hypothetical protein